MANIQIYSDLSDAFQSAEFGWRNSTSKLMMQNRMLLILRLKQLTMRKSTSNYQYENIKNRY